MRPVYRVRFAAGFFARMKGLLFTRPEPSVVLMFSPCRSIHTLGMRYPIDVAFLDSEGIVLKTNEHVCPGRAKIACPGASVVIERASCPAERWFTVGEQVALGTLG